MPQVAAKVRLSRKLGVPLTPKASIVMLHKNYGPGQHGQRRSGRPSDYGRQLLEKQRLKFQYNLTEKQLRNYFLKSSQLKGNTADNLIQLLEERLDIAVLRAGFATTIYSARQLVSHGHIEVDGKKVTFPSCRITEGMKVSVKEKSRKIPTIGEAMQTIVTPPYVEVAKESFTATIQRKPEREEVPVVCEISQVVEFYSR